MFDSSLFGNTLFVLDGEEIPGKLVDVDLQTCGWFVNYSHFLLHFTARVFWSEEKNEKFYEWYKGLGDYFPKGLAREYQVSRFMTKMEYDGQWFPFERMYLMQLDMRAEEGNVMYFDARFRSSDETDLEKWIESLSK